MRTAARLAGLLVLLGSVAGVGSAVAQGTPPPTPTVTVGGVVYAQYLYQVKDTANHLNAFDITRSYINVIGKWPCFTRSQAARGLFYHFKGEA